MITLPGGTAGRHACDSRAILRDKAARVAGDSRSARAHIPIINAPDSPYAYQVARLRVFGSYLSGAERLGDLDLCVDLLRRDDWPDIDTIDELSKAE